jgi:hypothetical protein
MIGMILRGSPGTLASFLLLFFFAGTLLATPLVIIALSLLEKNIRKMKTKTPQNYWQAIALKVFHQSAGAGQ